MADMDRNALREYLLEHNIAFHRSAHVDVLRTLYLDHVNGVHVVNNQNTMEGVNGGASAAAADDDVVVAAVADDVVVTAAAAAAQNLIQEEAALKAELRVLELRQRIAQLRRELADSADSHSDFLDHAVTQPSFTDIQHSIVPFSGNDSYDAHKWLADYERACASVNGNDTFKLKSVRRLMKPGSDAEIFLRTDNSVTYDEFRQNFLETFGHIYSVSEVIDKLNKTKFRPSEMTVMGYILRMQEIAARAQIDEKHTLRCIIDGFRDRSVNVAVLYPAQNLQQLKELARSYQHLREQNAVPVPTSATTSAQRQKPPNIKSVGDQGLTCFNCSGPGHISSKCPLPKRPIGSCFRCGSKEHRINTCPLPAPADRRVALADEFIQANEDREADRLCEVLSSLNKVSVAFKLSGGNWQCNVFLSLFDTGSPISIVRAAVVPSIWLPPATTYSGYKGLGNFRLETYGQMPIYFGFRNIFKRITTYIVPNNYLPYPIVLGRDFLNAFNIELIIANKNIKNEKNEIKREKELHCSFSAKPTGSSDICLMYGRAVPTATDRDENSKLLNIFSIKVDDISDLFDINPVLSLQDQRIVKEIIRTNYENTEEIPAIEHNYKMHIRLNTDIPISFRPRSLSQADKRIVEANVEELLKLGFIRPSESPYAFPLVLVSKKDGTKRQCVDYRALNRITVRDSYPLPLIDDCLEKLEGNNVFTTIDLKNGFHQVKVSEESIKYTAFVTPNGQYEYTVMPFGLKNGPMVFQRFINYVLAEFIKEGSVVVYMDDITLATKTLSEHLTLLSRVLRRLAEFRLQLKFSKCQFCYYEISLLGFDISGKGIRPNNKHLDSIRTLPYPKNVEEVRKCLGLFSYFRRFVPSFSSVAKRLRDLTKPDRVFIFCDECKQSFDYLREKLISTPVLALYNPERETELHCDASSVGFGAILFQKQDDQKFHPVAYFSKATTPAESRYHSFELETLAIIYALEKFRIYLDGIPFKIITDCNSLIMTLNKKSVNARIARWALELENYNYTIQHRKGVLMNHVDTLSRYHIKTTPGIENSMNVVCAINTDDVDAQLSITQGRDETISQLREELKNGPVDNYTLEDGLVFRVSAEGRLLLYVPKEMESNIIRQTHEKLCHMGIAKCIDEIKQHYWFPNMQDKVDHFIKNCLKCITFSIPAHCQNRTLHHIPKKPLPFDTLHLDHFGPLPSIISKRKHILVIVDAFTKFVKLFAVNSTSTKEVCACLDKYSEFYSRPRRIITDRGTCFTSLEFSSYLIENNVEHVKVATASPQANGQVERVNRVIKSMLAKISEPVQHSDWSKLLKRVEFAINNSVHSVTKYTPSRLLFGVVQKGCEVDALTEFLDTKYSLSDAKNLSVMRSEASENIRKYQDKSGTNHLANTKPHIRFSAGDYVMIRNVDTTIGTNKKFIPKFRGPYQVHKSLPNDRYVIRDIENNPYSQLPYDGILEASRLRHWVDWREQSENVAQI